ncbi:phosphohistidine phosphatase [Bowdeniella nasicola]|uniref:Phosphohistidine phosphatase n=1 Tax=Bowdeniella nasicola TaxID=208480 RepID=A0A1H4DE02_9ACTO|nr:histidine phosphatase family protein [Bowdeniella nasicola]SEA70954.1 phosphohistidine phosphatase [Bowdeniella nasicola]
MKTLVLLRHAKAEAENELGDYLRALSAGGRQQASQLGELIREQVGDVDTVLVSSALRTKETYRLLAAEDADWPAGTSMDALYEAGPRELIEILGGLDESAQTVLVVGHEPTMSSLAHMLHDTKDEIGQQIRLGVPTATACVLDVPVAWNELARKSCHVRAVVRPLT